ncbi:MAG TPA: hypothetical protein VIL52_03910 [Bacteroidota bacterium]
MKKFTFFAVVLSTLVAIPLFVRHARKNIPLFTDADKRYDLEDLIAEEAL